MSVAWTTILIIALLLPGVLFFVGYSSRERYTREIVRSSAIGEVGGAVLIAIVIHLLAWLLLSACGFDLASNIKQIEDFDNEPRWLLVDHAVGRLPFIAGYIVATAVVGFLIGLGVGRLVQRYVPFLATHKWINEIKRAMDDGLVTAYVMTTLKENKRVLMYKGVLSEFYLTPEGKFIYVVLKTCSRYYMIFDDEAPNPSAQLQLFSNLKDRSEQSWDYLLIEGANISNILFDPSPQILETEAGERALSEAVDELLRSLEGRDGHAAQEHKGAA